MTKDEAWLRGRAQLLCDEMHRLGVRVDLENAREFTQHCRRLIAAERGISEVRARALFTDAVLRVTAIALAESMTATLRAELADTGPRRLSLRGAQSALAGLLETVLLDIDDEGAWGARRGIELALTLAHKVAAHVSADEFLVLSGRALRQMHEALRDGAERVRDGETGLDTQETSDLQAFLTRMSNGILAAPSASA